MQRQPHSAKPRQAWVPKTPGKEGGEVESDPVGAAGANGTPPMFADGGGPRYELRDLLKVFLEERASGNLATDLAGERLKSMPASSVTDLSIVTLGVPVPPVPQPGARRAAKQKLRAEAAAFTASEAIAQDDDAAAQTKVQVSISSELGGGVVSRDGPAEEAAEVQQNLQPDPQLLAFLWSMQNMQDRAAIERLQNFEESRMAFSAQMYAAYGETDEFTTVMLRNIPNRYTRAMLMETLDKGHAGRYDFLYLPADFSSGCNVGYSFINFRTFTDCKRFSREFHGSKTEVVLPAFSSSKVCEVKRARVQGRDANMENLRDEKFIQKLSARPDCQPVFFDDQGNIMDFDETFSSVAGRRKRSTIRAKEQQAAVNMHEAKAQHAAEYMGSPYMAQGPWFPSYPGTPMPYGVAPWMAPQMSPMGYPGYPDPRFQPLAVDPRKVEFKMHAGQAMGHADKAYK